MEQMSLTGKIYINRCFLVYRWSILEKTDTGTGYLFFQYCPPVLMFQRYTRIVINKH